MFTREELGFIKDVLEEEIIDIDMEKLYLEDENEIQGYLNITKPRRDFINKLIIKINSINK